MIIQYPARIGGVLTRLLECGTGCRTIVFLHGVGARADRWTQNLPALAAAGYRCVAVDLPGHGMAHKGADLSFGPSEMRVFLGSLLAFLGIQECVWVGTSYGGLLALDMAAAQPGCASALVLVGCLGLHDLDEAALARMASALRVPTLEAARSKLHRLIFDATKVTPEWVEEEFRVNSSPGSDGAMKALSTFITSTTGLRSIDMRSTLSQWSISVPTALVWGVQDRFVPVAVGRDAAYHSSASLFEIDRACHAPYLERPAVFNDWVRDFLASSLHKREGVAL